MASKQKKNEYIERCVCKDEGEASLLAKGLVPKLEPHHKNPKWVANLGTRKNCIGLGKRKNYTHKLIFEMSIGTIEWLKQFEVKSNEPNSYEVPIEKLEEFNSRIISIKMEDNRDVVKKQKKK